MLCQNLHSIDNVSILNFILSDSGYLVVKTNIEVIASLFVCLNLVMKHLGTLFRVDTSLIHGMAFRF